MRRPVLLDLFLIFLCVVPTTCTTPPSSSSGAAPPRRRFGSPKGIPWTIKCLEVCGPNQTSISEQVAETLRQTSGIRPGDVFLRTTTDGCTRLYYGTYHRRTDPKTGTPEMPPKLREDLTLIRQLGAGPGQYLFLRALPVRMPTPDVGNPEWALIRTTGTYTLQVAVFQPTDEFLECKQAAADYCALLREKGYQAYYHHTDAASMVTVGVFGDDAIRHVDGTPTLSPEVMSLQNSDELLRYNRLNGSIYRGQVYIPGERPGERVPVPSQLVRMPGSVKDASWPLNGPS